MAITQDAITAPVGTNGTGTIEGTHTPSAAPRGILVMIGQFESGADQISGVTYGGVTMERIEFKGIAELQTGASYIYFLANPPSGAQTVKVSVSGAALKAAVCVSIAATNAVEVNAHNGTSAGAVTNPSFTLATTAGVETGVWGITYSGEEPSGASPGAGYTQLYEVGESSTTINAVHRTANGAGGNVTVSWTWNNDSCAACGVAVREVAEAAPYIPQPQAFGPGELRWMELFTPPPVPPAEAPATTPAELVLSAAGGATAGLGLTAPALVSLSAAGAAGAALKPNVPTLLALSAAGAASAALGLTAPTAISLAAAGQASTSAALSAPSLLTLGAAGAGGAGLAMTAPTGLTLAAAGAGSAVLGLTAPVLLALAAAAGSAAALKLNAPTYIALQPVAGVATATVAVTVPVLIQIEAAGHGGASLAMTVPGVAFIGLSAAGQAQALLGLFAPTQIALAAAGAGGAALKLTGTPQIAPVAIGAGQAALALGTAMQIRPVAAGLAAAALGISTPVALRVGAEGLATASLKPTIGEHLTSIGTARIFDSAARATLADELADRGEASGAAGSGKIVIEP